MERIVNRNDNANIVNKNNLGVSAQQINTSGAGLFLGSSGISLTDPQYKQLRKIYVGGIPDNSSERDIIEFFTIQLRKAGMDYTNHKYNPQPANSLELLIMSTGASNANSGYNSQYQFTDDNVIQISMHKGYAFVDFRTPQEATYCVNCLNGTQFRGSILKINRPKDFVDPQVTICYTYNRANGGKSSGSAISNQIVNDVLIDVMPSKNGFILDSPNKLFIGNLPKELSLKQICGYLARKNQNISALKSIHVPKGIFETDNQYGNDGFIFCDFYGNTNQVTAEMNKVTQRQLLEEMKSMGLISQEDFSRIFQKISDNTFLLVQRAPCEAKFELTESDRVIEIQQQYRQQLDADPKKAAIGRVLDLNVKYDIALQQVPLHENKSTQHSSTVVFLNCLNLPEDVSRFEEIKRDFQNECSTFGKVLQITIPFDQSEPNTYNYGENNGRILVKFADTQSAEAAQKGLSGKKYKGRTIISLSI
ncbi:predicted protein [Naegleria gruberi]|uniref:Predicted protein n=1 Tax=Naegleria gruberi TaxID=5762 RepID=D2UYL1_NAEGR|nr:uncharacterized protein NAEGRDRAFT_45204 [Naegleria gruberi]EFC50815.1 predicted protein [Naegleria gruberi]|eukprot:XP_002683559.1 predicted protein [Naegleria gruberi strain NEG-M]